MNTAARKSKTLITQATAMPTRKIVAGGIGGALSVLVIALLNQYTSLAIEGNIAAAITTLITVGFGYMFRESV